MSDPFDLARGLVEMLAAWRFALGFIGGLLVGTAAWTHLGDGIAGKTLAILIGVALFALGAWCQWRADASAARMRQGRGR